MFHAAVWITTLAGVLLLWSGARKSPSLPSSTWLVGLMLAGWGLFNLVEGVTNHHLLGIHHVREWGPDAAWDVGFPLSGPVLIGTGWMLVRSAYARRRPAGP